MTRGIDSSEKILHTTSGNECKFSWDSNARRKTIAEKTSLTITSSFRESLHELKGVVVKLFLGVFCGLPSTLFSFIYQDNLLKRTTALWSPKRRENCACICLIPQMITSK